MAKKLSLKEEKKCLIKAYIEKGVLNREIESLKINIDKED